MLKIEDYRKADGGIDTVKLKRCMINEPVDQAKLDAFHQSEMIRLSQKLRETQKKALYDGSVVSEENVLCHSFETYHVQVSGQKAVLDKAISIADRLIQGERFNAYLTGNAGSGKTHLAVAMMNKCFKNDLTVTFISVPALMELERAKVTGSISGQRVRNIEKRMAVCDLVVFDDLGSESSMQDGIKEASDFTQSTLFRIADSRVGKANIITTNESGERLREIYNEKLISRLLTANQNNAIKFDLPDHRIINN